MQTIEVASLSEGIWGVRASWERGSAPEAIKSDYAREKAVEARGRGEHEFADRVIAVAAEADRKTQRLDDEGTPKGWTTDPDEADRG